MYICVHIIHIATLGIQAFGAYSTSPSIWKSYCQWTDYSPHQMVQDFVKTWDIPNLLPQNSRRTPFARNALHSSNIELEKTSLPQNTAHWALQHSWLKKNNEHSNMMKTSDLEFLPYPNVWRIGIPKKIITSSQHPNNWDPQTLRVFTSPLYSQLSPCNVSGLPCETTNS